MEVKQRRLETLLINEVEKINEQMHELLKERHEMIEELDLHDFKHNYKEASIVYPGTIPARMVPKKQLSDTVAVGQKADKITKEKPFILRSPGGQISTLSLKMLRVDTKRTHMILSDALKEYGYRIGNRNVKDIKNHLLDTGIVEKGNKNGTYLVPTAEEWKEYIGIAVGNANQPRTVFYMDSFGVFLQNSGLKDSILQYYALKIS